MEDEESLICKNWRLWAYSKIGPKLSYHRLGPVVELVAYAERLKQAGARYELMLLDGAPHGMENWSGHAEWEFYKQRLVDWLKATLRI